MPKILRIRNLIRLPAEPISTYGREIARKLRLPETAFTWTLHQESIDARKKDHVHYKGQVDVTLPEGTRIRTTRDMEWIHVNTYTVPPAKTPTRVLIVGTGPAGLFAGYTLTLAGLAPILIEQGEPVEDRVRTIEHFWQTGQLKARSNVQFGEGGAGTFSDGKLTSRSKDPRSAFILDTFVEFGADPSVRYKKKPHVGTDRLRAVLINMRRQMIERGASFHFNEIFTDFTYNPDHSITVITDRTTYTTDHLILAIGHSARNTFRLLHHKDFALEPKPFAVGFRIEQSQSAINRQQYGSAAPLMPPADYALTHQVGQIGTYTFCMCPGGYVVAAASEPGRLVVNGMSYYDRGGDNANAAILATVGPPTFGPDTLAGITFQEHIEETAFALGGGEYRAPIMRVDDFLTGTHNPTLGTTRPTYRPSTTWADLTTLYPPEITAALQEGLRAMGEKMPAFLPPDAILTAPETRSSSPLRLLRDKRTLQSQSHPCIYPLGEGAGYAGGIVSSAIDGVRGAEAILKAISEGSTLS